MGPEFVQSRGLDVGSIQDLNNHNGRIPLSGPGGRVTEPLGYMMLHDGCRSRMCQVMTKTR